MPMIHVYVHLVWSTIYRYPFLNTLEKRKKVWEHIRKNAAKKDIHVLAVNGGVDHCHVLVSMTSSLSIKETVQLIKGESAFWINKQGLCNRKFEWQKEYYAASNSKKDLKRVSAYIFNQESRHKKKNYAVECNELFEGCRLGD